MVIANCIREKVLIKRQKVTIILLQGLDLKNFAVFSKKYSSKFEYFSSFSINSCLYFSNVSGKNSFCLSNSGKSVKLNLIK
ncbi:hypothetical protein [Mesomycoplasma hyorhinis]|uniref:hypothetical protein n=1 Tax=Mesomycoplasma hyorhinis TaxID=2100 RepID=UPI001F434491|nr:hypothetical protein [Mesomycoplasma hyorhinis]